MKSDCRKAKQLKIFSASANFLPFRLNNTDCFETANFDGSKLHHTAPTFATQPEVVASLGFNQTPLNITITQVIQTQIACLRLLLLVQLQFQLA